MDRKQRGGPQTEILLYFISIFFLKGILRMRMGSGLICLPHEQAERNKLRTIDYSFFFNTLIEELRVVKGLITYGLGAD